MRRGDVHSIRMSSDLNDIGLSSGPLAQVPEDIPLNYIRTAVLRVSDPHFSVSALLMCGMVYQQTLILALLEVLPAQLNSRPICIFKVL